ncbi:hypothetical protein GJAV_G00254610 [Gymnothorax javanicus]|nr:hypothetical protein GJAV_G00254610 [Gymnothorax javanicus]
MREVKRFVTFIFIITTVSAVLRSPYDVRMDAVNTRYILTWGWNQTWTNYSMRFTSEYTYSHNKKMEESYRRVCYRRGEQWCDFSHRNLSYTSCYALRVRAEGETECSAWSDLLFCPDEHASLGPPSHVGVKSGEAMLTVLITEPLTVYNTSMSTIMPLSYRIQYWERDTPHRNSTEVLETTHRTLTKLKPGTVYCLRVSAFNLEEEKISPYSSTQCVKTGGRGLHPGWFGLLSLCGVIIVICFIYWCRKGIRSYLRQPAMPDSIRKFPLSTECHLLELHDESSSDLVLELQRPLEDGRAEPASASAQRQDSSGQDSGIGSGGESDWSNGSFQKLRPEAALNRHRDPAVSCVVGRHGVA